METEPTENSSYLPATSPAWAEYYKRAKATRRLGKGQHSRIQQDAKRRRRLANLMLLLSTVLLLAVIAAFCALLGSAAPQHGQNGRGPSDGHATSSLSADGRRG